MRALQTQKLLQRMQRALSAHTSAVPVACLSQAPDSQKAATEAATQDVELDGPDDALAMPDEEHVMQYTPQELAPQPIFDRKFSKDELQRIRDNIPLQREPLYQPVSGFDLIHSAAALH